MTPSSYEISSDGPSKYENIEQFGADPKPPSHFDVFEAQFLQQVKQANQSSEVLDASNLMRITNKIMFVQMPEKYTEFLQIPAHLGIQKFGDEAITAMLTEYIQLDQGVVEGKPVIEPIDPSIVTKE